MCFETYEPFISSILQFLGGRGKLQITETTGTESASMGVCLYISKDRSSKKYINHKSHIFANTQTSDIT